jgi:drug/metabolite transporter (DMT)-like permease
MSWLLRLYPARWRKRYGEEFAAVLAGQRASLGLVFDVLGGAIDAHLHPQIYHSQSERNEGEDTMTNEMLQRCAAGGPKLSPRDQKIASMFMIVSALVMAGLYIVLTKIYHTRPAVEALGYASFPVISLIYAQTAYLRKRPVLTQILIAGAGIVAMYLFMLGACVIASKL